MLYELSSFVSFVLNMKTALLEAEYETEVIFLMMHGTA